MPFDLSAFDGIDTNLNELSALASSDLGLYTALFYPKFRIARHHQRIIDVMNDVANGKRKRVILTMPPRHGKSLLASQHFPAFYLGKHPDREVICATYSQDKADDWGREVRNQVADPLFNLIFPQAIIRRDSASARRFKTEQQGGYFAAGRNSPITGRGASVLVIDDIIKNDEEADSDRIREKIKNWWGATAYTRLTPDGAVVAIGTRWHDDDLIGYLLREHRDEGWEVIDFPAVNARGEALWPERFPLEQLRRIRRALSDRHWTALYQQRPYAEEGAIVKRHWWRPWLDGLEGVPEFIVVSLDTAMTEDRANDRTACTVWWVMRGDNFRHKLLLRYAWAERLDFPDMVAKIEDTVSHFGRFRRVPLHLCIETKASGLSAIQELRSRRPELNIIEMPANNSKMARAYAVQSLLENGSVYAVARLEERGVVDHALASFDNPDLKDDRQPEPVFRPWAQEVIDECAAYPRGRHDDYLDSVTHGLRYIRDLGVELFAEDEPPPAQPRGGSGATGLY